MTSVIASAFMVGKPGIAPLPFLTMLSTASTPSRFTASSTAGPRSPFKSGP